MRRSSPLVVVRTTIALALAAVVGPALAHHGVAGLGAAGLLGPGAPIEAATSATLPAGASSPMPSSTMPATRPSIPTRTTRRADTRTIG